MYKPVVSFALIWSCVACSTIPASSSTPLPLDPQAMLVGHNAFRTPLGLPALHWSPSLAAYAQEWADYLANEQGCRMRHRSELGREQGQYGENLFWSSARRWTDGRVEVQPVDAAQVTAAWGSEWQHYDHANNHCRRGEQCGHYTQMVWHSTREVGCAASLCPDGGQVWVCNYNPPGNWLGERPY